MASDYICSTVLPTSLRPLDPCRHSHHCRLPADGVDRRRHPAAPPASSAASRESKPSKSAFSSLLSPSSRQLRKVVAKSDSFRNQTGRPWRCRRRVDPRFGEEAGCSGRVATFIPGVVRHLLAHELRARPPTQHRRSPLPPWGPSRSFVAVCRCYDHRRIEGVCQNFPIHFFHIS